jgi:hypothetical protein
LKSTTQILLWNTFTFSNTINSDILCLELLLVNILELTPLKVCLPFPLLDGKLLIAMPDLVEMVVVVAKAKAMAKRDRVNVVNLVNKGRVLVNKVKASVEAKGRDEANLDNKWVVVNLANG